MSVVKIRVRPLRKRAFRKGLPKRWRAKMKRHVRRQMGLTRRQFDTLASGAYDGQEGA